MKRLLPLTLALALALSACASSGPPMAETPAPSETAAAPTQTPAPTGPLVYTDYSQLTPYEKPQTVSKFTRRYPEFTDHLIPADDYGPLIPFPGAVVTRSVESSWGGWDYNLYGLMTLDGEVIVDPVFSSAFFLSFWDEPSRQRRELDCLILQKVVRDENGEPMSVAALCARDGSWCTGFDYIYDWDLMLDSPNKEVISLRRIGDGSQPFSSQDLVFLDVHTGEELKTIDLSPVAERWPTLFWSILYYLRYKERYSIFSDNTAHYLFDAETGEARSLEEILDTKIEAPYATSFSEGLCPVKTASGYGYIDGSGRWVIDPVYEQAGAFENGRALVVDQKTGYYAYIDRSGEVLFTFPDCDSPSRFGEFISYESRGRRYFLDKDLKPVPLPEDFFNPYKQGDWFIQELPDPSPTVPGGYAFWNVKTGVRQDFSNEWDYSNVAAADKAILKGYADRQSFALADLNTGEVTPLGRWASVYFSQDSLTGETLMWLEGMGGAPSEWRNLQGDTLYTTDAVLVWGFSFWGDRVLYAVGDAPTTLTNWKTGELLFSWPLRSAAD